MAMGSPWSQPVAARTAPSDGTPTTPADAGDEASGSGRAVDCAPCTTFAGRPAYTTTRALSPSQLGPSRRNATRSPKSTVPFGAGATSRDGSEASASGESV